MTQPLIRHSASLFLATALLLGCGGGGSSSSGSTATPTPGPSVAPSTTPTPPPANGECSGDDCRRLVLRDIGEDIILPALRDFDLRVAALVAAAQSWSGDASNAELRSAAQSAWRDAMVSWQRNELLQVGPSGRSTNPDAVAGGQDFRDRIYSWPLTLDVCGLEEEASAATAVNAASRITRTGLGALEYLIFFDGAAAQCPSLATQQQRAEHAQRVADWLQVVASSLRNRWEPEDGNFLAQWSTAGAGSSVYSTPQEALNALSIALFYAEKVSKDRKIALPSGLPAAGLECANDVACPEFLESPLSRQSGGNLTANYTVFRDVFSGVNDGLGINDLLVGIDREDLATEIITELGAVFDQLQTLENSGGFDAAVESIDDADACMNAFSNSSGLAPCALLGIVKTAMDTFRGPIVGALSLAIPSDAAGDND